MLLSGYVEAIAPDALIFFAGATWDRSFFAWKLLLNAEGNLKFSTFFGDWMLIRYQK